MINKEINSLITDWINKNREGILDKWISLAKIPSIKSSPEENAPFGKNCAKALNLAADLFRNEGFDCEVDSEGGYALAYFGKKGKIIGLFSHSDVVPVGEGWLYTEPFEPVIIDGALIGRGVEDNKSGIIHAYCIYKFLKDNGIELRNSLQTFIGSDEECGMQDMDSYLEKHTAPDISIVPDADFPCSVGEKGIYHFWAESDRAFQEVTDFFGGEAFNIVLDNAVAVIKHSDELERELKYKAEGNEAFTVTSDDETLTFRAKGVAKHASIPEGSVNAALIISEILSECSSLCENDREIFASIKSVLSSYYGAGIGVEHEDEKFGKLTSVNGMVKLVDSRPCISFDVRYGSTLSPEHLVIESRNTLKNAGFTVTVGDNSPGFAIEDESKFPSVFEEIYAEIIGERLDSVRMAGGTYARRLKNAFSVGTYAYEKDRKTPVLKMPDGHGGAHQCDEMIDIEGFFTALRILIHYIFACDSLL